MKIDILHYSVPPVVGGVESVIGYHARLMTQAGHTVRLVAGRGSQMDKRIPFLQVPLVDSLDSQVLAFKQVLDKGEIPTGFEAAVDQLEQQLRSLTVDANFLVAHNVCSLHKNLVLTAALHRLALNGGSTKLVLWHHDLAWTARRYQAELHQGYPWDLLKQDWPGVMQVVVSKYRQEELAALTGIDKGMIHVVPNGIDVSEFMKLDEFTLQLVDEFQLLEAAPLALLPVRITRRKNIELALHILATLRIRYPKIKLVISGPPGPHNPANLEYFGELSSLRHQLGLEQAVIFLAEYAGKYLPDSVIFDLYRLADIMLLPSREEGFGIPLIEAGLAGVPVFCASIPTLQEAGGESVDYFPPEGDPAAIASQIHARLEANRNFAFKLRIKRDFTWQHIYQDRIARLFVG